MRLGLRSAIFSKVYLVVRIELDKLEGRSEKFAHTYEVEELVLDAWRMVVPKRVAAAFVAGLPDR